MSLRHHRPVTIKQQTLNTLREGILTRRWAGTLPGVRALANELGVAIGTIQAALKQLEAEALLDNKGARHRRQISSSAPLRMTRPQLRVGILGSEALAKDTAHSQAFHHGLMQAIKQAGHIPFLSHKTLDVLKHEPAAVLAHMQENEADAWVVTRATQNILETLLTHSPAPFIAHGGRVMSLTNVAATGVDLSDALRDCVRSLAAMGHTRIVMILPAYHWNPTPSMLARVFLDELTAVGINPGPYHLPAWEYSRQGFDVLLKALFSLTSPTALILEDARQYTAALNFLLHHHIPAQNIALVVTEQDTTFDWSTPRPGVIRWDNTKLIARFIDWIESCARGTPEREKIFIKAHFEPNAISPPPKA